MFILLFIHSLFIHVKDTIKKYKYWNVMQLMYLQFSYHILALFNSKFMFHILEIKSQIGLVVVYNPYQYS